MAFKEWFNKVSLSQKDLYYKLLIIFGLFFIVPVIGVIYFAVQYDILNDAYFAPFFLIFLIFVFFGFRLLRKMFDNIKSISASFTKTATETTQTTLTTVTDELGSIVQSFRALEEELKNKVLRLDQKTAEVAILKELSDISYMTLNADYLLFIALERALKLVNADVGSVMILTYPEKDTFVIKASIGLSEHAKKGTTAAFEDSVAKFTVINKAPLLVEDIETDSRFGRQSRGQYATKSFICMPLKTSNEIIGVVTISRKRTDLIFTQSDVDILTPLLSNVAYIYDNINLSWQMKEVQRIISSLKTSSKTINSSLKGHETLQVIFEQMRNNFPFDLIALLGLNPDNPRKLSIVDFKAYIPTNLSRGRTLTYENSIMEMAMKEQRNMFIPDVSVLSAYIDKKLFGQNNIHTALVMPLKAEGRITSLLLIFNLLENDWNNHKDVIDVMGDHLSLSMEKDQMIDALTKRDREIDHLRLIGSSMTSSALNVNKALNQAMDVIQSAIPAEAGYLMLPENDELSFAAAFHLDMHKLNTVKLHKGEGVAGHVFERGEPIIINNAQQSPQFSPIVDRETGFSTKKILSVPLMSDGHTIGVIEILNKTEGDFTDADEKMLQSIAANVSTVLEMPTSIGREWLIKNKATPHW